MYNNEKKVEKHMETQGPQSAQQGGMVWVPGATTIGVVCRDGAILASEKRVAYGYFIVSKGVKKVFKITDKIGAACAGLVGDMQILVREVEAQANLLQYGCWQTHLREVCSQAHGKHPLQPLDMHL